MKRDKIADLKEGLVKLTRILAEKNIPVHLRGTEAFVQYDGDTHKPILINIPSIPDNATEKTLQSIQGFIDHEIAHVLFTETKKVEDNKKNYLDESASEQERSLFHNMFNAVEDCRIEKMVSERFLGSENNLNHLRDAMLDGPFNNLYEAASNADSAIAGAVMMLVPYLRAKAGQKVFEKFMEDKMDVMKPISDLLPSDYESRLKSMRTTEEMMKLATELYEAIIQSVKSDGSGTDENEDEGGSGKSGENEEEDEDKENDEGEGENEGGEAQKILEELSNSVQDFDELASKMISDEITDQTSDAPYYVYTKEFDQILTPHDFKNHPRISRYRSEISTMDDSVSGQTNAMITNIRRLLAARTLSLNVGGFRSGRLRGSALHKLTTGDDRIFQRKHEKKEDDTAISILVDLSGSMMQSGRARLAGQSAYAISKTLDTLNINYEIIGFTTDSENLSLCEEPSVRRQIGEFVGRGGKVSRLTPLYMVVFKEFNQRFTTDGKAILSSFANFQGYSGVSPTDLGIIPCENIDGESLEISVNRLLRQKELRKVQFVLSDGYPNNTDNLTVYDEHGVPESVSLYDRGRLYNHLRAQIDRAINSGVELNGIGIQSGAVSKFYPNYEVVRDLSDLPKATMRQLKNTLFK